MTFIEGSRGNVLFTGDFRLPLKFAARISLYSESFEQIVNKKIKPIDHLYIDATFFKPEVPFIPTREESTKCLLKFLKEFLDFKLKSDFQNLVFLKTSARIGYEYIFQEIYSLTGYKTHVNNLIFNLYGKLPQIQCFLTTDPYETPIHSCVYKNCKSDRHRSELVNKEWKMQKLNCKNCASTNNECSKHLIPCLIDYYNKDWKKQALSLKVNAVKIILSSMWFTNNTGIEKIFIQYKPSEKEIQTPSYLPYKSVYRLCYSFHSSFEEIVDFVNTLKPKKLYSIALPEMTSENFIIKHFYNSNNNFVGFNATNIIEQEHLNASKLNKSKNIKEKLVIKKRQSNDLSLNSSVRNVDFYNQKNDSSRDESDDLVFSD